MASVITPPVVGRGGPTLALTPLELREILEEGLSEISRGERVLAIIADKTRDDNTATLFPFAADILSDRGVSQFDALVAQGTHRPMTVAEKRAKIGADSTHLPKLGEIFDHRWDRQEELVTIGELDSRRVAEVTGGLLGNSVRLTINRLLSAGVYDSVLIFGGTVPHEVAGFAGGAKYFFPGVAGPELTHATHWLAALATVEGIIGRVETPTRHLIEAAADFVPAQVISFTSVVTRDSQHNLQTHALFAGDFRKALRKAVEVSRQVHIKYTGRKYRRVVALLDEHYDELWVGGKASYRLGPVIEEGGELIIYAPHLRCISETHGHLIERYGYAPLETVRELVAQSAELEENLCVAAHLTQVAYAGRSDASGRIVPRYHITMATGIDEETCRRVNLGFMDHRKFRRSDYEWDSDTLIVERAGQDLYLVEPFAS
ncbi:MAG: lactate racemase domain-containing protein [Pyrinomonadaceae bacterium]